MLLQNNLNLNGIKVLLSNPKDHQVVGIKLQNKIVSWQRQLQVNGLIQLQVDKLVKLQLQEDRQLVGMFCKVEQLPLLEVWDILQ